MKKVIFLLPVIFINIIVLYSQSPQAFKYQAVARDNSGNILISEELDVRISIISDSINGNTEYNEGHTITTNDYGSFALQIGTGNVQLGDFSSITWGAGNKFVKVEAKKSSDLNYEELATSQLLSVPYALYSENAASSVWNKNGNDINYLDGNVGIGTTNPGATLSVNGFTQLGGTGADVPKIKTKIITGTLDGNASEDIPTGLTEGTFLDFEMIVDYPGSGCRRSGYNGDGADGFFEIKTLIDNIRVTSKGSGIINQPYKLFIIYQE